MVNVLNLVEVAEYLRVHPSTIYRLIKKREIPAFKIGSDWRFNQESIDRWCLSSEGTAQVAGSVKVRVVPSQGKRIFRDSPRRNNNRRGPTGNEGPTSS
jgi:excisionase family DNA binding protein